MATASGRDGHLPDEEDVLAEARRTLRRLARQGMSLLARDRADGAAAEAARRRRGYQGAHRSG